MSDPYNNKGSPLSSPILSHKHYDLPSVFTVENMLRESRRQKSLPEESVPSICILDPDGDMVAALIASGQAQQETSWACYHTRLYTFKRNEIRYGIIPHVVGASFAVLVAEELFACGCQLLISMTSAGQIVPKGMPPYFVLIERALRDEGTSYHYLPATTYSHLNTEILALLENAYGDCTQPVFRGATWTTDAPFRETPAAIDYAHQEGILGVEMEAAALYAFAEARNRPVVCFAHITNQMAQIEGDFEKGLDNGSHDALEVIGLTGRTWVARRPPIDSPNSSNLSLSL